MLAANTQPHAVVQVTTPRQALTAHDYHDLAELLYVAQADLLATAQLVENRHPLGLACTPSAAAFLRQWASRAADLRELLPSSDTQAD
jgi:hypothetical protein